MGITAPGRFYSRILPALRDPAGQSGRLPDPTRHELLVELVVLVNVEVAGASPSAFAICGLPPARRVGFAAAPLGLVAGGGSR
jgi:hypothetical protein